jgi:hypothetical protein
MVEQTTLITWPPTAINETKDLSRDAPQVDAIGPSFLLDNSSAGPLEEEKSATSSQLETQLDSLLDTQYSQSFRNHSEASSIARFPIFHFNLHTLTSLSQLSENTKFKGSIKVNVLLAVLEMEGPDTIRIKKGPESGKEIAILKMILGDEEGIACKLTAWREVAEEWGGSGNAVAAKRGDIVHIESKEHSTFYQKDLWCLFYFIYPRYQGHLRSIDFDINVRISTSEFKAYNLLSNDALYP